MDERGEPEARNQARNEGRNQARNEGRNQARNEGRNQARNQGHIHETAIVEPGATVGAGTAVWHHSHVRAGAVVGDDCTIGKNVYVDAGVVIGARSKIQNNVSVYAGVTLGDEVFVGPSAVFTNDRNPRAVGDWEIVPTVVGNGASIGANATVVCGVAIGAYAMVGAGAVVTHPVADHELVLGTPARHAGWVCDCGAVVARTDERPADLRCAACRDRASH